jgi:hypothetical protein
MDAHSGSSPAHGKGIPKELETPWLHSIARLSSIKKLTFSQGKVATVP